MNDLVNTSEHQLNSPIFIMGCHRTGTTLVRQILNTHSRINIYHETNFYSYFFSIIKYYGDLSKPDNLKYMINDFHRVLEVQRLDPSINNIPETKEFLEALIAPTFPGLFATMMLLDAKKHGKSRGGEKTPRHYQFLPHILEDFPNSPVIFLMRDPRDTVHSIREQFGTSIEGATADWNEALYAYEKATRPLLLVRYEDLVRDPQSMIEKICDFIGEEYEASMLTYYNKSLEKVLAKKGGKLLGAIDTSSIGKFNNMTQAEIKEIEKRCEVGMRMMDYPFTLHNPSKTAVNEISKPQKTNNLRFIFDRLVYYHWSPIRWRHGSARWKIILRVRIRYLYLLCFSKK